MGTSFTDVLEDTKESNLSRRQKELESLGEGKPGDAGSTKTKEEAVRRARAKKDENGDTRIDVNGNKYDRMKAMQDAMKEAGARRR